MIIDILKSRNSLSSDAGGKILVSPISQFEFKTNPIGEGDNVIAITEDEYIGLLLKLYQFDETLQTVIDLDDERFKDFFKSKLMARFGG